MRASVMVCMVSVTTMPLSHVQAHGFGQRGVGANATAITTRSAGISLPSLNLMAG
jgi:hypothetical protein